MEVDQVSSGSAKRLADATETASIPAESGSSSDKRQRQQLAAPLPFTVADDASSSLLPLQPLTEEAALRLQRLGSPEEEQEEEGAALALMLGGPDWPNGGESAGGGSSFDPLQGLTSHPPAGASKAAPTALADQLSELHLVPGSREELALADSAGPDSLDSSMSIDTHDVAARVLMQDGPPPPPGSPAAVAEKAAAAAAALATAASPHASPQVEQPLGAAAAVAGQTGVRDPLIRDLAAADAAAPIQMLSLDALSKNPLLQQYQQQRAADQRARQTAQAVAAGAAFRAQQGMVLDEEDDVDLLDGTLIGGGS